MWRETRCDSLVLPLACLLCWQKAWTSQVRGFLHSDSRPNPNPSWRWKGLLGVRLVHTRKWRCPVVGVLCSSWNVFCHCKVPGALSFDVFRTLTLGIILNLSVTLTLGGAVKMSWGWAEAGAHQKNVVWSRVVAVLFHSWHGFWISCFKNAAIKAMC